MSGDVTVKNDKFTMPSGNVEIKAIFEEDASPTPTEYTVTFDGNDGTPSVGSMTTTKQKLTSLPDASRSKYSFNGWYTEKERRHKDYDGYRVLCKYHCSRSLDAYRRQQSACQLLYAAL